MKMSASGELVTRFVCICDNLEEAKRCIPELSLVDFHAVREGRKVFIGDTINGIELVAVEGED